MIDIVNFDNTLKSVNESKIFFGTTDGIQRYDRFKHPISDNLVKVQQGSIWFPKEISYVKDMVGIMQIPVAHRTIYTLNLGFQTVADTYANRHLDNVLCNYVTSPEWERVLKWQAIFELIHSEAYSENIRKVFVDAEATFQDILSNPEIHKRLELELSFYKQFCIDIESSDETVRAKAILRECIIQYALENLRFMISFLYTYRINEANGQVLQGSVNNITLILNDETIHTTIFKHLLNILRGDASEGFIELANSEWFERTLINVFSEVIASELKWFEYLNSIAEFEGFNINQAREFLEFYAEKALRGVKVNSPFDSVRNELVEFFELKRNINGVKSLAQETDVLSYNIGVLQDKDYYTANLEDYYEYI